MPVRNEEAAVDETLAALFASTRLPDEIVVADAMSTDRTLARIEAWQGKGVPIRVVPNPTIYCGGARNIGARSTDCDLIVIVDFGNPVFPRYIEEMVRPFEERDDVDITMGILLPLMRTSFEHCMGTVYYDENILLQKYTLEQKQALLPAVLLPGGGCVAMTRRFLLDMGGYPEWLARSQDRLFSRKAHSRGARVVVAWEAYCYNHVRGSARQVYRMAFGWARCNGQSRYVRKHFVKAVGFYSVALALLGASALHPAFAVGAVALLGGYFFKAGWRRLLRVDGRIERASYLWHVPALLVAGDMGTIAGHVVGWYEWFTRPDYRRAYNEYVQGCPPELLPVIEQ